MTAKPGILTAIGMVLHMGDNIIPDSQIEFHGITTGTCDDSATGGIFQASKKVFLHCDFFPSQ
jgi:hypothetical protein